jgi:hypothetical protein
VLVAYRCEAVNMRETRMNTDLQYHSSLFTVAACLPRERTATAEAAGSSPVVPAIPFKHLRHRRGTDIEAPAGFVLQFVS